MWPALPSLTPQPTMPEKIRARRRHRRPGIYEKAKVEVETNTNTNTNTEGRGDL